MKLLVNLSNHPSAKWQEEQKAGWDKIIDVPFPSVSATSSTEEVIELVAQYASLLGEIANEHEGWDMHLMLQGEYTFCYLLLHAIIDTNDWKIAIPTTERRSVEKVGPGGETIKTQVFDFVRWRII